MIRVLAVHKFHKSRVSLGFPTRFDTNRSVQPQKNVRGLTFRIRKKRGCTIYVKKIKALITTQLIVAAQLICAIVFFAYANNRFSHDAAHMEGVLVRSNASQILAIITHNLFLLLGGCPFLRMLLLYLIMHTICLYPRWCQLINARNYSWSQLASNEGNLIIILLSNN